MEHTEKTFPTEYDDWSLIDSGNAEDFARDEEARDFAVNHFGEINANVLLSAAAGSGKTYTLVERIANRIAALPEDRHVTSFAVVTFTRAAAAELRERIGRRLIEKIDEEAKKGNTRLAERLYLEKLLLSGAMIGTIDSFAMDVVKNNFAGLGISPNFTVDDEQVKRFRTEATEDVLEEYYAADRGDPGFKVLSALMDTYCDLKGDDALKKQLFDPVLEYAENMPNPEKWLKDMPQSLEISGDIRENPWYKRLSANILERIDHCVRQTVALEELIKGEHCAISVQKNIDDRVKWLEATRKRLELVAAKLRDDTSGEGPALFVTDFSIAVSEGWPNLKRGADEAEKNFSKLCLEEKKRITAFYDKAIEDLNNLFGVGKKKKREISPDEKAFIFRKGLETQKDYTELVCEIAGKIYGRTLAKSKQRGVYSFSQIAHFALRLLNDGEVPNEGIEKLKPSAIALGYRQEFAEIYLDEYQDTSEIQEFVIHLVSGVPEGDYNIFMVGDIKQSIYGFRNAKPDLFLSKFERYREEQDHGVLRILSKNFRSRKTVLDGVNEVFFKVMTPGAAGIDYRHGHKLNYGGGRTYDPFPVEGDEANGINEMLICSLERPEADAEGDAGAGEADAASVNAGPVNENAGAANVAANGAVNAAANAGAANAAANGTPPKAPVLTNKECEPAAVADRICSLFENGFTVFDKESKSARPLRFGDVCVIAAGHRDLDRHRDFLGKIGLPVDTGGEGMFFEAAEVQALINLLRIIDNPRKDIPLAALLMSDYFGCDENFLAGARLEGLEAGAGKGDDLWVSLHLACGKGGLLSRDEPDEISGDTSGQGDTSGGNASAESGQGDPSGQGDTSGGNASAEGGQGAPQTAFNTAVGMRAAYIIDEINALRDSSRRLNVSQFVWKCINYNDLYARCGSVAKGNLRAIMSMSEGYDSYSGGGLAGFVARLDQLTEMDEEHRIGSRDQNRRRSYSPDTAESDKIHFMTIHGSKGLEFPVVFLVGTKSKGNPRGDANVFIDKELGLGFWHSFKFRAPEGKRTIFRTVTPTVAGKILKLMKSDEEARELQRKLYVALTRAREKLFVTGNRLKSDILNNYDACGFPAAATDLAVKDCGDSYDLMRLALAGKNGRGYWRTSEFVESTETEITKYIERARAVAAAGKSAEAAAPVDDAAGEERLRQLTGEADAEFDMAKSIGDALSIADGASLPTKISVSALKRYAVDEEGAITGEPYSAKMKPNAFRKAAFSGKGANSDRSGSSGNAALSGNAAGSSDDAAAEAAAKSAAANTPGSSAGSGAAFGTLMHLILKWAVEDRAAWPEDRQEALGYAARLILGKQNEGALSAEETALADPGMVADFIASPRGREVRAAEDVRCEVPFTYLTDMRKYIAAAGKVLSGNNPGGRPEMPENATELPENAPGLPENAPGNAPECTSGAGGAKGGSKFKNNLKEEKNIVIQGVVDLYYKLQDRLVIVDFKTDHIRDGDEPQMIAAYRMQIACYKDALEDISGEKIQECLLFFLRNGREIRLEETAAP